jgi:hypothetical protein
MLIYLDSNVVQDCADERDFVSGQSDACKATEPKVLTQLRGLRKLIELEQLGDWTIGCCRHLLAELHTGKPTLEQLQTYATLRDAWSDSLWATDESPTEDTVRRIEHSLDGLKLKQKPDQRHLAEALALNASWFITNDKEIVKKTKGAIGSMRVSRPLECLDEISVGLLLR